MYPYQKAIMEKLGSKHAVGYCRSINNYGKTLELYRQINRYLIDNPTGICQIYTKDGIKEELVLPEVRDRVIVVNS